MAVASANGGLPREDRAKWENDSIARALDAEVAQGQRW